MRERYQCSKCGKKFEFRVEFTGHRVRLDNSDCRNAQLVVLEEHVQHQKFKTNLTIEQACELAALPLALQKVYVASLSNLPMETEFTFHLIDLIEILHQFQSLQRSKKHSEENECNLLTHSGGVNMI